MKYYAEVKFIIEETDETQIVPVTIISYSEEDAIKRLRTYGHSLSDTFDALYVGLEKIETVAIELNTYEMSREDMRRYCSQPGYMF